MSDYESIPVIAVPNMQLGYQGDALAYATEFAKRLGADVREYGTIHEVFMAVKDGTAIQGIVPKTYDTGKPIRAVGRNSSQMGKVVSVGTIDDTLAVLTKREESVKERRIPLWGRT